jgi:hypothetical protein
MIMWRSNRRQTAPDATIERDDAQHRRRGVGPFSGGQLTAIIIAVVISVGFPVGAFAALSFTNVSIIDPHGSNRALVNYIGQLETHQSGPPGGSFTVSSTNAGGFFYVKLPGCSTSTCHVVVSDVVLSQENTAHTRLQVSLSLYSDTSAGACTTVGTKLKDILPYDYIPAADVTTVNFSTPIVVSANPACLVIGTGSNAGLFFTYTVNGYRQP